MGQRSPYSPPRRTQPPPKVTTLNGLGAKVVAVNVSCRTAVYVARAYTRYGDKVVNGYACGTTHVARSSADRSRFRCTRGSRVIRVELRS